MVVHTFNPSNQETEAGGSLWVRCQPDLQSKFQHGQGYIEKPVSKNQTKPKTNKQKQQQNSLLKSYAQASSFNHKEQSMSVTKNGYNWKETY